MTEVDAPAVKDMSYWEIIAEIDASYFVINQIKEQLGNRAPIQQMIDSATGYDKRLVDDAKTIVSRVKELQAALPADDPHFTSKEKV